MRIHQDLSFTPSDEFKMNASVQNEELYQEARKDREAFWAKQAECLDWFQAWDTVLEWEAPVAKWFLGGKLNAAYNCLDRHMRDDTRFKTAILWEGERGESRALTYEDLFKEVNKLSNVLKELGVEKGDRVAIYLPLIPEAVVSMLSCARIGAVHTVVFAGFSADSLRDRIIDSEAKVLITADGGFRKGKTIHLKETADMALVSIQSLEHVLVVKHSREPVSMTDGRDIWYHEAMEEAAEFCPPEAMDSEDPLYILYTSGTTGKPKGIVHTTAGYMVGVTKTMQWVFDIKQSDIYWCTADVGWVTGHSYVVYGPLSNGTTQLLYEGAPDYPERNRFWKLIEKYGVTILYTAPTAIRMFMKWGEEWLAGCDLSSLRLLGSVGEPINPDVWLWYYTHVGYKKCPVVDTWWQTETGSIMIAPIPGITALKPGSASKPLPGIELAVVDDAGNPCAHSGYLAITSPWPSMLRGIYKDFDRYQETYWKKWEGRYYFTGDGARRDDDGYFWLMGRVDDVINVSGHRLGTMELESALVSHPQVAESAVIAMTHPIKGQGILAFVSLREKAAASEGMDDEIKQHMVKKIGAIARPERVIFIAELPKTRSGKIMRRLLRDIAEGRVVGDTTTLSDPLVVEAIKSKYQEE